MTASTLTAADASARRGCRRRLQTGSGATRAGAWCYFSLNPVADAQTTRRWLAL